MLNNNLFHIFLFIIISGNISLIENPEINILINNSPVQGKQPYRVDRKDKISFMCTKQCNISIEKLTIEYKRNPIGFYTDNSTSDRKQGYYKRTTYMDIDSLEFKNMVVEMDQLSLILPGTNFDIYLENISYKKKRITKKFSFYKKL